MISFICALCTFDDWYRSQHARPLLENILKTQCFFENMRAQNASEHWIQTLVNWKEPITIKFYEGDPHVVGYTEPPWDAIYLNRVAHNSFSYCKTASNIAHEMLHLKGFRHFADAAYATNYAFEPCCNAWTATHLPFP